MQNCIANCAVCAHFLVHPYCAGGGHRAARPPLAVLSSAPPQPV